MQKPSKGSTKNINYEFKKITGQIINYRQVSNRQACVSYQTILLRGEDGEDYLLRNINVSHVIDPYLRAAKGIITVIYAHGQGDGQKDQPFIFMAGVVTSNGKTHLDIGSLYTFSRGVRAQARLPYLEMCKGGVALCLVFIGVPIVIYAVWRLIHLKTPLLTEDFTRKEINKLGILLS